MSKRSDLPSYLGPTAVFASTAMHMGCALWDALTDVQLALEHGKTTHYSLHCLSKMVRKSTSSAN